MRHRQRIILINGIGFNPTYYSASTNKGGLSISTTAKTISDSTNYLHNFRGGWSSDTYNTVVNTNTVDFIAADGIGPLNIGTSATRTTLNPIMIGGLSSLIRYCGNFACSIDGATQTLSMRYLTQIERISPPTGNPLNIADTQLSGALNIGTSPTRSGDIAIANTQTSGVANIIFGSMNLTAGGTQKLIINRPLSIGYPNAAF